MRLKYLILIIFVYLLVNSCSKEPLGDYEEPENLIQGYSFETDDLENWFSYSPPENDFTLQWNEEEAFDGNGSLRITSNSASNQNFAFWQTRITEVEVGKTYKVRARIKGKDLTDESFSLNMFARVDNVSSGVISGISGILSPDNEWQEINVELESPVTENIEVIDIYFILHKESEGTIYVDKVELFY